MALGSFDGLVSLWDMESLACYKCADRCLSSVKSIDISPEGTAVIGTLTIIFENGQ
jgi:WD40 repeat protein